MKIHPTAVIHPKAVLADDVEVGAYSVVGEHVRIGAGTRVFSHVCIDGWTDIGERCELHPFVSVGGPPQHMQYKGEPTKVVICIVLTEETVRFGNEQPLLDALLNATAGFLAT